MAPTSKSIYATTPVELLGVLVHAPKAWGQFIIAGFFNIEGEDPPHSIINESRKSA